MKTYVAFLRGINVNGHHKVPMVQLRVEMETLGFTNIITILNSGNVLFDTEVHDEELLEKKVTEHLEKVFGFPIPTMVRSAETIYQLLKSDPFKDIVMTKDIRLYISFLKDTTEADLQTPWTSEDNAYTILVKQEKTILSVLDVSINKTPKAMKALESFFGKNITTRNWNTIKRIEKKLEGN
ncbi:DUF1697 domain-containing protein [Dokdonia sp.]|uniref:DUF1697 domain-containing protein n=1 Tax=Dokdonia sp. TaxID=2024995 RepID=UPI0032660261